MRSQQENLERLSAMDNALEQDQSHLKIDIENVLKQKPKFAPRAKGNEGNFDLNEMYPDPDNSSANQFLKYGNNFEYEEEEKIELNTARSEPVINTLSEEGSRSTPKAPESSARQRRFHFIILPLILISFMLVNVLRFQKAKLKVLTKQVEDGVELRRQLQEQVNDLQRQLKSEREENKRVKKR